MTGRRRAGSARGSRRLPGAGLLGAALLLAAGSGIAAPPEVVVVAPPSLAGVAQEVRDLDPAGFLPAMDLLGLTDGGAAIRVVVAEEASTAARGVPGWVSGFALPSEATVVLFPSRTIRYPDDGLAELLRHEVAHVLLHRKSGGRPVPRWFSEGFAVVASREVTLEDRTRVAAVSLLGSTVSVAGLDRLFRGEEAEVHRAYALSTAFFRHLLEEHGGAFPARVLDRVREGVPFESALERALGAPLPFVEHAFWNRQRSWDRWLVLLTSTAVLWTGVTLLGVVAAARRRRRDARTLASWAEAERRAEEDRATAGDLGGDDGEERGPDYPPRG
ncbi:MAG: hypothetical protein EDX89_19485 [Acidobacteria bacterium]|nr:MAG: hypothetical protein EDX89_19485 [Acidobacteriota bacterium]